MHSSPEKYIVLKTNDDKKVQMRRLLAEKFMGTLRPMLEEIEEDETSMPEFPVDVEHDILQKVIGYCQMHAEDPVAPGNDKAVNGVSQTKNMDPEMFRERKTDDIGPEDEAFCKVDQCTLFALVNAANYLDIPSLLDLTCKTVANMIKGKTPEQIRQTFNIENDFTPEEEERIRQENAWCENI